MLALNVKKKLLQKPSSVSLVSPNAGNKIVMHKKRDLCRIV